MPEGVPFRKASLDDAGWKLAIRNLAAQRVTRILQARPVWKEWREDILKKLCSGDYTYLYVVLNLEALEHSKIPSTREALWQHLMTPLSSIDSLFSHLVSRLHESEPGRLAINWIYHATRPLTPHELAAALALGTNLSDETRDAGRLTFDILAEKISWDPLRNLDDILGGAVKLANDRNLPRPSGAS